MHSDDIDWRQDDTLLDTTGGGETASSSARVPGLTILAHADPQRVGERLALPVLAVGHAIQLSRLEPVFRPPRSTAGEAGRPLMERSMSRQPIRLAGRHESGEVVVDVRDTRTPVAVDGQPVDGRRTLSAVDIERGVVLLLGRHVVLLLHLMTVPPPESIPRVGLVGESDAIVGLRQEVKRLASLDLPVLLRGESGTGKELVARALHDGGPRHDGPFVAVNMATLSPSLAAAELFGVVRGAYTGADRERVGFFESAQHGTLFLDEIGETPVEVQAMLLRALESQEVLPVGSVEAVGVDVRVIAATDARLEEAMAAGRFRVPLFHRLTGYTVDLPPLRTRRDDIGRLLRHFLAEEADALGTRFTEERPWPSARVVARLARHDWPGNVRELRNVARRLAIGGGGREEELLVTLDELMSGGQTEPAASAFMDCAASKKLQPSGRRLRRRPEEVSEEELLTALEAHGYRMRETAEALDLSRIGFYRRLENSPNVQKASDLGRRDIEEAVAAAGGDVKVAAAALRVSVQGLKRRITALGLALSPD